MKRFPTITNQDEWVETGYEEVNDDGDYYSKEQCEEYWEGY